jgi:hypothetical protein
VAAERSPEEIQREIEAARVQLGDAVDEIAARTSPKKVSADLKALVREKLETPVGKAVVGGAGLLLTILIIKRLRK